MGFVHQFSIGILYFQQVLLRSMESDWYLNGFVGEAFELQN